MKFIKPLVILFCSVFFLPSLSAQFGEGWTFLKEKEGIKVWTKPTPNSNFKQVMIKSEYNATLSTMVSIGRDILAFPDWVYKNIDAKILKQESDQSIIYHSVSDMPWPIEDRDAVIRYTVKQDPATKIVQVDSKLLKDYPHKSEGTLRAEEYHARWQLTPLDQGKVEVVLCVKADPGGSVPAWLANLFVDRGPIETFIGLKKLSQVEPYKSSTFDFIKNQ